MLCLTFCKITKAQAKRIISDDEAEVWGLLTSLLPTCKIYIWHYNGL